MFCQNANSSFKVFVQNSLNITIVLLLLSKLFKLFPFSFSSFKHSLITWDRNKGKDTNLLILRCHKTLCHFWYHKMNIFSSWICMSCHSVAFHKIAKNSKIGNKNLSRIRNCRSIKLPFSINDFLFFDWNPC